MAKKLISSSDLSWLVSERLSELRSESARISVAVVPDEKVGWRAIVDSRGRRYLTSLDEQRLADVQRTLRLIYELQH
jgi:hypothetical protein